MQPYPHGTGPVGSSWTLVYEGVSPGVQLWSTVLSVSLSLITAKLCLLIPYYSCNHRSSLWAAQTGLGSRVDASAVCPCNLHISILWPVLVAARAQASFSLSHQNILPAIISSSWRAVSGFSFGKPWSKSSHLVRWSLFFAPKCNRSSMFRSFMGCSRKSWLLKHDASVSKPDFLMEN